MGADTTSTQLIFFIAATLVATAAAGILSGIVLDLSHKMEVRGKSFGDEIESRIEIINDPRNVVTDPDTVFYLKNTGKRTLDHTNVNVILDGSIVATTNTLMSGAPHFAPGTVLQIVYDPSLAPGDHTLRIVVDNGIAADFTFRIS